MGNTVGVECSYNHVRLTSIMVKGKMRSNHEEEMNGGIGADARRDVCQLSKRHPPQVGTKEQIISHKTVHNCISGEGSQCKSDPPTPNGEYLQMQKDIYAYMLTIRHLIVGHVHLVVLCQDKEKNEHLQILPSKMGTHLEEPFSPYDHFVEAQSGEAKKNNRKDPLPDDQIAQIYFITIRMSSLDEALANCPQKMVSSTIVNLTGKRSTYLRKKILKLKKMNNLSYHEEVKCINSALVFLAKYYPRSFYKFEREESTHGDSSNMGDGENKNRLREKFLIQMGEAHEKYPYLLVSVKRGITYHLVSTNNVVTRVGSCFVSYKSVVGLFFLITGKVTSIERICQLAKRGDNKTFDMSVGDIYGTSYGNAGLSSDLTASFFGNAQHMADVKGLFGRPPGKGGASDSGSDSHSESHSDSHLDCYCDCDCWADDPLETPHCACPCTAQKARTACSPPVFHSHSDEDLPHEGGLTTRKTQNWEEKHILMVSRKCQSDTEMETNIYSEVGCCGGRTKCEHLLFDGKFRKSTSGKKKKSSKCYEQVRRENVNLGNDCAEGNPGQIDQSHLNKNKGDDYQQVQTNLPEEEEKPNKYECDLSKSLLSIVIFNTAQQAYIHSQLYNVKNVFFSGYLLDHSTCVGLMKVIVNFMYHNVQQLHFCTLSSYMSSFGCALQGLRWGEEGQTVPFC
ncbi:hypothetical protein, conserved [Plasmodium vivax]|uniref:Pantothenate kinase n=2 Tax=Plasmodium vivax TaxID=5855 RepID=A5K0M8_PLAVS|nr:hypothetical protein, conserved [Plasmodium vivax]EDL46875.1 hypothetical protein, conserved [Plasmodium vivax]KMZ83662.1 hypothetical protein PVBG_00742 [Plasmodium vivax Brazil I]|eukprot:XP_001616602.1 hypothetical protein [Plasmodium vivax Sal-1]